MTDPKKRAPDPEEVRTDPKAKIDDSKAKNEESKAKKDDPEVGNEDTSDDRVINIYQKTSGHDPKGSRNVEASFSHEAVKDFPLWIAAFCEFIGTLFLVLIGCGSTTSTGDPSRKAEIAFAFGLIVAVMVQNTAHISGGHINPAVTVGMLVTRNIPIIPGCIYIVCQLLGAVAGSAILFGLTPKDVRGGMGVTAVSDFIEWYHALGIEILITFLLVFTVFSVIDPSRPFQKGMSPILIGLSVAVCHLWAIPFTGSSMNTARSFGPALITNSWDLHWVYWVGPIIGGVIAGLLYKFLFSSKPIFSVGV